jgi:Heterokaryon incompatibility protein Het-C
MCRRDYSQAIDVGTVSKGLDAATIRILVWVFGFLSFGYATEEFEVRPSLYYYVDGTDR